MIDELKQLFERDLKKLKSQVELYESEDQLWLKGQGISNSAGNLALHIIGNLNHFIGGIIGATGYQRDREFEFGETKISKSQITKEVTELIPIVKASLDKMSQENLADKYPIEVFGNPMTYGFFLIHLHSHLNYHLGQINYHRRLLAGS